MSTTARVRNAVRWRVRKARRLLRERRATTPSAAVVGGGAAPAPRPGAAPAWGPSSYPQAPVAELLATDVRVVERALLTRNEQGPVHTPRAPKLWIRGAAYDGDELVPTSCRVGGLFGEHIATVDPVTLREQPAVGEELEGTWLYGGHWMHHFGHYMLETLTSLWPDRVALEESVGPVRGLVFHRFTQLQPVHDWQETLLAGTGWGGLPIHVVDAEHTRVERLVVPGRSLAINGWALPEAAATWRRIARHVETGHPERVLRPEPGTERRVYLSRAKFAHREHESGRKVRVPLEFEDAVDRMMAERGFEVVHPETLPIVDQVLAVSSADVVVGRPGSQLHLSIYAPPTARVLTLGDARSPHEPMPAQRVLDTVAGQQAAFIPYTTDMTVLTDGLDALGL